MNLVKKVIVQLWKYIDPIRCARYLGVKIGNNCKLFGSTNWGSEPYLISIGDHTEISFDVAFVTHDGATWVFRNEERYAGAVKFGKIKIGNDCFIGARSTIMPGVCIGDKCIVAAGAVVTKSIPTGEIWGGVPARFISTTEHYAEECLLYSPEVDGKLLKNNRREAIIQICDGIEHKKRSYVKIDR